MYLLTGRRIPHPNVHLNILSPFLQKCGSFSFRDKGSAKIKASTDPEVRAFTLHRSAAKAMRNRAYNDLATLHKRAPIRSSEYVEIFKLGLHKHYSEEQFEELRRKYDTISTESDLSEKHFLDDLLE
jgi:hypothetical protein